MTVRQIAELIDASDEQVVKWIEQGVIKGTKEWIVTVDDLLAFLAERFEM
jgi:hypothetical protein